MATVDTAQYLRQIGASLIPDRVGPTGKPLIFYNNEEHEFDVNALAEQAAKQEGISVKDLKIDAVNSPDQAYTASPLSLSQRGVLYGATSERAAVKYLKENFEDVKVHPEKGLLVRKNGVWSEADPSAFSMGLSLDALKELGTDVLIKAPPEIAGAAAGLMTANPVTGLAVQGAGAAAARSIQGYLYGSIQGTPEELAGNILMEGLTGAALGGLSKGAKALGAAAAENKFAMGLVAAGKKMKEGAVSGLDEVFHLGSGVTKESINALKTSAPEIAALTKSGNISRLQTNAQVEAQKVMKYAYNSMGAAIENLQKSKSANTTEVIDQINRLKFLQSGLGASTKQGIRAKNPITFVKSYMNQELDPQVLEHLPKTALTKMINNAAAIEYASFLPRHAIKIKELISKAPGGGAGIGGALSTAAVAGGSLAASHLGVPAPLVGLGMLTFSPRLRLLHADPSAYYKKPGQLVIQSAFKARDFMHTQGISDTRALEAAILGVYNSTKPYEQMKQETSQLIGGTLGQRK